jgi:lysophospholipase L1-like esterase
MRTGFQGLLLHASAGGASGISARSLIRSIAVLGSSSVEQNQAAGSGGNNRFFSNGGIHVWMCAYLRQRLMMEYNASKNTYEFGLFGAQNSQILATCVPQAITAQPNAALLYCSLNDLAQSFTPAQMLASTQAIYNALIAGGIKTVIIQAPGPRNVAAGGGVGYFAKQQSLIALLQSWTSSNGIPFVDVNSAIQDPVTGDWKTGYTLDGTHPNTVGAQYAGFALASWMETNMPLSPEPFTFDRANTLKGPNPFNLGGTATLAANITNFPGSRSTPYLENATDGGARWQGANFYNPDSSFNYHTLNSTAVTLAAAGLSAGQLVRSWCELTIKNGGAMKHQSSFFTNGTGIMASGGIDASNNVADTICPIPSKPVVFAGPVFQIPADATTCSFYQGIAQNVLGVPTNRMFRYAGAEVVSNYKVPVI